jgi:hypothetical protein
MVLAEPKRALLLLPTLLVVVRNMTAIIVHEVAALIVIVPSMDARTIEEEEEAVVTTVIAVMTRVQGEIVTPVDVMMIAARMVAKDAIALIVLPRPTSTLHVKSAISMDILQKIAGGVMEMMMILTVVIAATKVIRVQITHLMV